MKKNLISIIILALLIVNIVLTSIMMFSVTGAAQKTSALITDIASVVKLETAGEPIVAAAGVVSVKDTTPYNIADPMTIPLKSTDGVAHYVVVQVSLSLNNKHADFKEYGEGNLDSTEAMIQNEIINVFGQYTVEDVRTEQETIKKEILERIHNIYQSDFIYNISFRDIKYA